MTPNATVVRVPRGSFTAMLVYELILQSFGVGALAHGHIGGGIFLIVVWWPFFIPLLLSLRVTVRIEDEALVSHGWFRETTWRRNEVEGIQVVSPRWSPNMEYIQLRATNGHAERLPGTLGSPWLAAGRRRRQQLETLTRWLVNGSERIAPSR